MTDLSKEDLVKEIRKEIVNLILLCGNCVFIDRRPHKISNYLLVSLFYIPNLQTFSSSHASICQIFHSNFQQAGGRSISPIVCRIS